MTQFQINNNHYRVYRTDSRNISLQKFVEPEKADAYWVTISYHGNSVDSLARGILDLIVSQCVLEGDKLVDTLEHLKDQQSRIIEKVLKQLEKGTK